MKESRGRPSRSGSLRCEDLLERILRKEASRDLAELLDLDEMEAAGEAS